MPASIGVNLRVTGHCRQGGRKYMEDFFSVAYQQTEDERDLEYAFFGIYDGHGGAEAAAFAKEHLMETIVKQKNFWSDNDSDVLRAIKDGYIATHYAMWKEQEKWPKTASGLPSTAGTTASVAFIRRGKIYIGHVGDSGIILGYQEPGCPEWKAKPLTKEHKPESAMEMSRIESCGGKVVAKSGVPRVVWNRPRIGHQGPVRRSTPIDEIPFLAVARSLGDLWSYNSQLDEFVVSPDPDCSVIPIDTSTFRCLIFGTDGLYNMLNPQMAVHIVQQAERHNENAALSDDPNKVGWLNPSKCLVEKALERWSTTKMRADNTSVVTLMLDPPGPPRAQVLKNKKKSSTFPDSGLKIVTRYEDDDKKNTTTTTPDFDKKGNEIESEHSKNDSENNEESSDAVEDVKNTNVESEEGSTTVKTSTCESDLCFTSTTSLSDLDVNFTQKTRESLSYDVRKPTENASGCNSSSSTCTMDQEEIHKSEKSSENIQIHEISSSSNDTFEIEEENASSSSSSSSYQLKSDNFVEMHKTKGIETRTRQRSRRSSSKSSNDPVPKNEVSDNVLKSFGEKPPDKEEKSNIRESLRSATVKMKEKNHRKRRTVGQETVIPIPTKRPREFPKNAMTRSNVPRLRDKNKQKKLLNVSKVVLKQKIRALQRIMTRRVPALTSGIVFDNRTIKQSKTKALKSNVINKKDISSVVSTSTRSSGRLKAPVNKIKKKIALKTGKGKKTKKKTESVEKTWKSTERCVTKVEQKVTSKTTTKELRGASVSDSLLTRRSRRSAVLARGTQKCNCC